MTLPASSSRRALLGGLLGGLLVVQAGRAFALEAPSGTPVLSITGAISQRNTADAADFDMAMLERLPQHSLTTLVPWYSRPRTFTGVRLRELLALVGARGDTLRAIALNDYRVDIPVEEVRRLDVIVAHRLDDQPMTVREKGPLVIMYPFDTVRELRNPVHFGRAAWQLRRIEVR